MNTKSILRSTKEFFLSITFSESGYIIEVSELHKLISDEMGKSNINHMKVADSYRRLKDIYHRGIKMNDHKRYYTSLMISYDKMFIYHRNMMATGRI